jgi:tripartite-type tricarboxylate transporter receptor subunit TctC
MSATRRHVTVLLATALAGALVGVPQAMAAFPEKPITLVVPYAAGGITDVQTRLVARKLEPLLGQPVVVENKPGASAQIGSQAVVSSKPDGYTLLVSGSSSHVMAPALKKDLPYDTVKDFVTVAMVAQVPLVLAVPSTLPVSDLKSLVAMLKAKKEPYNFGHAGVGTGSHVTAARLSKLLAADVQEIGYQGTNPALVDLAGGRLTMVIDSPGPVIPHVQSGKVKVLAVFAKERLAALPDVPTVGEAGLPEAMKDDWELWQGISAPAATPRDVVLKLNAALQTVLKDPEVTAQFRKLGLIPILGDADYAQKRLVSDFNTIVPMLKSMGIQPQ